MIRQIYRAIFTGFYSGYSPVAPGTAGTLVALIIYIVLYKIFGERVMWINLILLLVLLAPAAYLCGEGARHFKEEDPGRVVLDEILGYMVTVGFIPFSYTSALLAFVFFRLFDILKPWPIKKVEKIGGGIGILADDLVAGIFANALLRAVLYFIAVLV